MSELRYLLFLGCTIPYRVTSYEISARKVFAKLGIELVEMPDFNCCGLPVDPADHEVMLALAARNLSLAEEQGLNIITLCTGCATTLRKVNKMLKQEKELKTRINEYLKEVNMEFKGTTEAKHFIQAFKEDLGFDRIKETIQKPLTSLEVAEHCGCHLLRPSKVMGYDDPEDPRILKGLVELTGAKCLDYADEAECCGYTVTAIDEKVALQLTREKIHHLKAAGAQALITVCPSCHLMFDMQQLRIERMFNEKFELPVLHYPQLLGLAMGFTPEELAFNELRVNPSRILEAIKST
nr:CoB--CoM heterodisulfide reductase iron-sulfur subunit B family protein [Candidatus Njordarchaeum guaymaensis]